MNEYKVNEIRQLNYVFHRIMQGAEIYDLTYFLDRIEIIDMLIQENNTFR